MSGILEVFGAGVEAIARRSAVPPSIYRKFINWTRWPVDPSSNRPKVAHFLDTCNALHGHPSEGSLEQNVAWWRRTFEDTPLCIDEEDSRVYMGVLWPPEVCIASLALSEPALASLLPLVEKRMEAWLGKLVPKTRRGAPREIRDHRIGEAGVILGNGDPVPSQGVCWFGIGDRSIVLDRGDGSDERTYLDRNPANQWLAILLGIGFSGGGDSHAKRYAAAFAKRKGGRLWMPSDKTRAVALAALDGNPQALAEAFLWQTAVPFPKHESEVARKGSSGWCRFAHTKDGTTQGGSGSTSDKDAGEQWLTGMPGTRESKGGADNVQPVSAVIDDDGNKRRVSCWPDRSPSNRYAMRISDAPDEFHAISGPSGIRVLSPAVGATLPVPWNPPVPLPAEKPRKRKPWWMFW